MGVPSGGAIPRSLRNGLAGPKSCSHASAVTCGAIISGMTKQSTKALRARRSVSATTSAISVPPMTASNVPPIPTTSVLSVAVQVELLPRPAWIADRENVPPGSTISWISRSMGMRERTAMMTATASVRAISWPRH